MFIFQFSYFFIWGNLIKNRGKFMFICMKQPRMCLVIFENFIILFRKRNIYTLKNKQCVLIFLTLLNGNACLIAGHIEIFRIFGDWVFVLPTSLSSPITSTYSTLHTIYLSGLAFLSQKPGKVYGVAYIRRVNKSILWLVCSLCKNIRKALLSFINFWKDNF